MANYSDIGKRLADQHKQKPKFTVKEFKEDVNVVSANIAKDFIRFFNKNYLKNVTDIKTASQLNKPEKPLTKKDMMKAVKRKDKIVFIDKKVVVHSVNIADVFNVMEYGRVDKGIMPNPQIREAFRAYKPIYVKHIKSFLRN